MRRLIVTTAIASVAALALAGCVQSSTAAQGGGSDSSASGGKKLTVFISGDTNVQDLWQKNLIPAFEKANPGYSVAISFDLHGAHDQQTIAKLTAASAQKKSPGFDLVDAGFVAQLSASNLLTKVSSKNIPPLDGVKPDVVKAGGGGGIPYRGSSVLLAYDSKTVPNPPKTLDSLLEWIKSNPGKFAYNSPDSGGSGGAFVTTVLDSKLSTSDRKKFETSSVPELESKWDPGFATLASLNPYVYQKGVYPNGNNQVLDLLSSGQISMAPVWSDQFVTGKKNGQIPSTVESTQISNPSFTGGASYLGIPKISKNQDAALKLAAWVLSPKAQASIADGIAGYPVISLSKLPQNIQKQFKDFDVGNLRPGYFATMNADENKLWAQKVPGK
ncbi:MAG TPA: extracellular solute-binding protein [Microbacteriaceae bacterium]|jgi:putative spermidine/putrescine transport system substrate-binding protein|nr:extracellular solute-binding protein [Microbacteriaceae bacterium]